MADLAAPMIGPGKHADRMKPIGAGIMIENDPVAIAEPRSIWFFNFK